MSSVGLCAVTTYTPSSSKQETTVKKPDANKSSSQPSSSTTTYVPTGSTASPSKSTSVYTPPASNTTQSNTTTYTPQNKSTTTIYTPSKPVEQKPAYDNSITGRGRYYYESGSSHIASMASGIAIGSLLSSSRNTAPQPTYGSYNNPSPSYSFYSVLVFCVKLFIAIVILGYIAMFIYERYYKTP